MLANVNPVLDPLLVTPLRNAVVKSAWGRGKIDVPPGIAKKINDTPVVTSKTPERAKGQKLQVRDERKERGAPQAERAGKPAKQQQPQAERVAAPARVKPQQQPDRVKPQQQPKQERASKGGPPSSPGGGKGKGKKP